MWSGVIDWFNVGVRLHQRSTLSYFVVMDKWVNEVRQEAPSIMMFADDSVI